MGENEIAGTTPPPVSEEGREARTENEWRSGMSIHGRRWKTLAGKGVLALAVAVGAVGCSLGGFDLSELEPGQCFSGDVEFYPPMNIEVIECSEASPLGDYMVVFTESAAGDSYPGNLDEIGARCAGEGGMFLQPSSSTWDDGDRVALCHKPPLMSESFG